LFDSTARQARNAKTELRPGTQIYLHPAANLLLKHAKPSTLSTGANVEWSKLAEDPPVANWFGTRAKSSALRIGTVALPSLLA
jgi:hypothetical protein